MKKAKGLIAFRFVKMYPKPESNRHGHYWPLDFKSSASTNSAIRAILSVVDLLILLYKEHLSVNLTGMAELATAASRPLPKLLHRSNYSLRS